MRRSSVVITVAFTATIAASAAEANLDLYIDKSSQNISVVQNGSLLYVWPVSTGGDAFSTPNGVYTPERLERSWFSKAYYSSPMPHAIFFHNGYAIHGSYDIARLGGPASHGCVRLHPQNAAMLFAMVEQEGPANTRIVIGGDSLPNPQGPRSRDPDDQFRSASHGNSRMTRGANPPSPQTPQYSQVPSYPEMPRHPPASSYPEMSRYSQTSPYPEIQRYSQASPYSDMQRYSQASPYSDMQRYSQASPYSDVQRYSQAPPYSEMPRHLQAPPYTEMPRYSQTPSYPEMQRYSQAPPYPQMSPYYDTNRYMEAPRYTETPGRRRGDNGQFATRGIDPANQPPALRRDAGALDPAAGPYGGNRPSTSVSAVNRAPAPRRDAAVSGEPTPAMRSNRLQAANKLKCPACSANPAPEEPAKQQVNSSDTAKPAPASSASEPEQPSQGYKVLPKSYWTGASWRWRSKSDQENH